VLLYLEVRLGLEVGVTVQVDPQRLPPPLGHRRRLTLHQSQTQNNLDIVSHERHIHEQHIETETEIEVESGSEMIGGDIGEYGGANGLKFMLKFSC
jgi:hypothetical protein